MNLFYNTPTDSFVPLSHDNTYLFNHYDKITNFLSLHMDRSYRHILAKPIKNNYDIDWYSRYPNLKQANNSSQKEFGNSKYWEFYTELENKIVELSRANDDNTRDWISILKKVFNPQDNLLFTNGIDVCIVWGWKFENNQIVRPDLLTQSRSGEVTDDFFTNDHSNDSKLEEPSAITDIEKPKEEIPKLEKPIIEEFNWEEEILINEHQPVIPEEAPIVAPSPRPSFLEFLKYFAGTYWWLLIVLLGLITLLLLYKLLIV